MNGKSGDASHVDTLRERKKPPRDELVRVTNAGEIVSREHNHDKKTFGKTPDGAGE